MWWSSFSINVQTTTSSKNDLTAVSLGKFCGFFRMTYFENIEYFSFYAFTKFSQRFERRHNIFPSTVWQLLLHSPWPTNIWKSKLRGQFLERTQQSKRTGSCMCYLDLCIQLFFFPKDKIKSISGQNVKKISIKNIKMKPPVAQFKKKSKKLCLFLKSKSQNLILSTQLYVVCIKRKT